VLEVDEPGGLLLADPLETPEADEETGADREMVERFSWDFWYLLRVREDIFSSGQTTSLFRFE
jgi:hypothetical protein